MRILPYAQSKLNLLFPSSLVHCSAFSFLQRRVFQLIVSCFIRAAQKENGLRKRCQGKLSDSDRKIGWEITVALKCVYLSEERMKGKEMEEDHTFRQRRRSGVSMQG